MFPTKCTVVLLLSLLASACATRPSSPPVDPIAVKLLQLVGEARATQQMLAQVRAAEARTGLAPAAKQEAIVAATYVPAGFDQEIRLDNGYTGPVEGIVEMLAAECGYAVEVLGRRPPEAVIVSVPAGTAQAILFLRDVAWQAAASGVQIVPAPAAQRPVVKIRYGDA